MAVEEAAAEKKQAAADRKAAAEQAAARAEPGKQEMRSFVKQQKQATPLSAKFFSRKLSDPEIRNAYSDVRRHNEGLPTAYYKVKDGAIVFDEDTGQPVPRDPGNGYRKAEDIGTDISSIATTEKVRVGPITFSKLDPADQKNVILDPTLPN